MNSQRFVKTWIADAKNHGLSVIPVEHLRTVYHTQTEQNPAIANREFHKRLIVLDYVRNKNDRPGLVATHHQYAGS